MAYDADPATAKALVEAEGDVARHGVVIIRTIETELVPSVMAAARDSLESSPRKLSQLKEDDLDDLVHSLRKAATKSSKELTKLYTRVLSKLGNEDLLDLEKDLEGVDQLFRWQRIEKAIEPVNEILAERGFSPLTLSGPEDIADNLKPQLEEKFQPSFVRFSEVVRRAAREIRKEDVVRTRASGKGRERKG